MSLRETLQNHVDDGTLPGAVATRGPRRPPGVAERIFAPPGRLRDFRRATAA
ncbi:hypothetical protein [Amycolatopsis sp. NPDC004625]|uniref:hypothetical protein n=1 Tax=Amycolatopsis sp. NPDC004625 TaxID=3154670 RepID=UPI0033A76546